MVKSFICGVVEGFYGKPWTMKQRADLFPRVANFGMDTYMYAPKDDFKHRSAWRIPYSPNESEQLRRLIEESKLHNIRFIYALSPGLDMIFSSEKEMKLLMDKLDQVRGLGCDSFALLFDDIEPQLHPADEVRFQTPAHAQAYVTNEVYHHMRAPSTFLFCPTEYCEAYCQPSFYQSSYLPIIGAELNLGIDILWTGPRVISKHISCASIRAVNKVLKRKVIIWDNLHANDYDQRRMFLGPYSGRSPALVPLLSGVLTNPNCEYEINFIPLRTLAIWSKLSIETTDALSEDIYDPSKALNSAIIDWLPQFSISENCTTEIPLIIRRENNLESMEIEQPPEKEDSPPTEEMMSIESEGEAKKVLPSPTDEVPPLPLDSDTMLPKHEGMSIENLSLLCDMFYLPYQHGARAVELLQELSWLVNFNPDSKQDVDESTLPAEWTRKAEQFRLKCGMIDSLFSKIDGPNRSLHYEIHPYVTEVQSALYRAKAYISRIERKECSFPTLDIPRDPEPWVFQGGFGAELTRILPAEAYKTDEVSRRPVENPSAATCVYFVRPYCVADQEDLYKICLLNSDNGQDGSHLFPDHPDIIGDRGVGPYLEFAPELAYVLTDDAGVCGYVLGVVDTQSFYEDVYTKWLPRMCEKYSAPGPDKSTWNSTAEVANGFHNPPKVIIPDCLSGPYPSHIKFNLLPRAQGKGMGESLITCVLESLKNKGSKGVHLDISPDDIRYLNFYTSLGFKEITMPTQPLNQVFLGKIFPGEVKDGQNSEISDDPEFP